ncbi:MAG: putative beta-lysine N-acetyltransferase [Deltaproteobacteria bacterium]|nr:putative beta-lysine N-acetyltransferase [Deltaproteobacteria bacterium]
MPDTIETFGQSILQHGSLNDRVYLIKLHADDLPRILDHIDELAAQHSYSKLFAKIPARHKDLFILRGYQREAFVPGFFAGSEDAEFLCRYLDPARLADPVAPRCREVLAVAEEKRVRGKGDPEKAPTIELAKGEHAEELAAVYAEVFPSYPFPIHDPGYLRETMESHVRYFLVRNEGRVVAVSSSEMDRAARNVEMTDFATLPSERGKSLALYLLEHMEREMRALGMRTAYTIARALSAGMNVTFARMGYLFGGQLVNNTNISGQIESMNVWYKDLG